jgi:predicted DNA binding CopG/RHH family protein
MSKPNAKRHDPNPTKVNPLPSFESEAQEREFWESEGNDATGFFDLSTMVVATFKNLKPSTTSISLRLTDSLLDGIRQEANKLDVPYQSLMKVWLTEKLREVNG